MWVDLPWVYALHKFKCISECWDAGWVDSLTALGDMTVVCGPTADFTLQKLCIHECATYALLCSRAVRKWLTVNWFSTNLMRAKDTQCMERIPGASSFLCVRAKNRQISVHGERYANLLRMAQHRFAVLSTHARTWFTNHSQAVCEPLISSMPCPEWKWCEINDGTVYCSIEGRGMVVQCRKRWELYSQLSLSLCQVMPC